MKLVSFSVSNYRSITRAHKIELHDLTILVGKNNEGKSNIIKAISLSMNVIKNYGYIRHGAPSSLYSRYLSSELGYSWDRDFPVNSQKKETGSKNSKFELEFMLSNDELMQFNKFTSSRLSTPNFIIIIEFGPDNYPNLKVSKKGTSKLNKNAKLVSEFVTNNLVFNYIPSIRTESQAINLIKDTLSQELKVVEKEEDYINAIKTINRLQQKPLNNIANKVKETLKTFIPSIKNVEISIEDSYRKLSLRRGLELLIDDGALTNIEYKGDGIKSLATLAMLTDRYNVEQSSIIAIDEPEAHLHPGSIRQLNNILNGLIKDNQVIIATHNQLFINKNNINSNVIVSSGKAHPAKNIKEIRETLGIKLADNLISCNCKLFVEGTTDKKIIEALCNNNPKIKKALSNSEFCIDALGGASKLAFKIYESNNSIFDYYVLLDNDSEGLAAYQKAESQNLLDSTKVNFTICQGKKEAELEDLIDCHIYVDCINKKYNTNLSENDFKSMKKWSNQLSTAFLKEGKLWNEDIEMDIKNIVADECCKKIRANKNIFLNYRVGPIDSLIKSIEKMIEKK